MAIENDSTSAEQSPIAKPVVGRAGELLSELADIIDAQEARIAELRIQQNLALFNQGNCAFAISNARTKQGLTLDDLALLSGVSTVTLGKLEKGQLNVNLDSLLRVVDALGISLWIAG